MDASRFVFLWFFTAFFHLCVAASPSLMAETPVIPGTRIDNLDELVRRDSGGYAHRQHVELILNRLELQPGDVVLDLGAGDGWWTEHFAKAVGPTGTVYAAEVSDELVKRLEARFREQPWVKPYLCPKDRPGLSEAAVDLVFISQVYHHLEGRSRVDYWKELARVVKPTGRVVVIETYPQIAVRGKDHGTPLGVVVTEAEQGGWVLVESWYIPKTQHYFAVFLQQGAFFGTPSSAGQESPATSTIGTP